MNRFAFYRRFRRSVAGGLPTYPAHFQLGMQENSYSRSGSCDLFHDRASQCQWVGSTSSYVKYGIAVGGLGGNADFDGTVNEYNPGETQIRLMLKSYWARLGDYEVVFPAGMTITSANLGSKTLSGTDIPAGTGLVKRILTITQHTEASGTTSEIKFAGYPTARPTGPLQLRPTIYPAGEADPNKIASDEVVASYIAMNARGYRTMDSRGLTGHGVSADLTVYDFPRIKTGIGVQVTGVDWWVDLCNRANLQFLNYNISFYQTDAATQAEVAYMQAHLNPGIILKVEWVNEIWNTSSPFVTHWEEAGIKGIEKGFETGNTSVGVTPHVINYRYSGNFFSKVPQRNFNIGDTVCGNASGIGIQLWRAKQAITALDTNATLPSAENAYWYVDVGSSAGAKANRNYYSYRAMACYDVVRQAVIDNGGDGNRVVPTLAWQSSSSVMTGQARDLFLFDNAYLKLAAAPNKGRHMSAPYYGGQSGFVMGLYDSADLGTWTAAVKQAFNNNYNTDPSGSIATALAAYFDPTAAPMAAANAISVYQTRGQDMRDFELQQGLPANSIQVDCYECGNHTDILGGSGSHAWPNGTAAAALAVALQYDLRNVALDTVYMNGLRQVGGDICYYARFGALPWVIQQNELDRGPLFQAIAAQGAMAH